jgi:HPt (histidine-containing phosphotransfer) domain-containing protein
MNYVQYEYYKQTTEKSHINKFINGNTLSKDDIYNKVYDLLIDFVSNKLGQNNIIEEQDDNNQKQDNNNEEQYNNNDDSSPDIEDGPIENVRVDEYFDQIDDK